MTDTMSFQVSGPESGRIEVCRDVILEVRIWRDTRSSYLILIDTRNGQTTINWDGRCMFDDGRVNFLK